VNLRLRLRLLYVTEVEVERGGDGLSECEMQSHMRNHLPEVNQTDVRDEEGVQDEVKHKVGDEVHQYDNLPDPKSVRGCERSAKVDVEGLVDVQISFDNGDQNLFEGSVEVQCQVQNEQESEEEEQTEGGRKRGRGR